MFKPSDIHDAVNAVCPIDGISFANPSDKTSWRVDFKPEATDEQKAAAQSVIDAADPAPVGWVP